MINRLDMNLGNGNRPYQYKVSIELPTAMATTIMLDNNKVDALCKRASIPDMQMDQVSMYMHGREVKVPFSTTYSSESTIGFYVDDDYFMRHLLEFWMLSIDCYKTFNNPGYIDGLVPTPGAIDALRNIGTSLINKITSKAKSLVSGFAQSALSFISSSVPSLSSVTDMISSYIAGMNKSGGVEEYAYGRIYITPLNYNMSPICTYTLYNVYPTNLTTINYSNDSVGSISEFDATFYYSHYTIESASSILGSIDKGIGSALTKMNPF